MSHNQAEKAQTQADAAAYQQQQQQQAAMEAAAQQASAQQAVPAASGPDPVAQLKELGELKAQGILTEEEFAAEKAKILAQ